MSKEILQITIQKPKEPKTQFGKWWHRNMYWKWVLFSGRVKKHFYGTLSKFMLSLLPKEKREEILKEYEEVEVHIVNESEDDMIEDVIKKGLQEEYGEYIDEAKLKKEFGDLLN